MTPAMTIKAICRFFEGRLSTLRPDGDKGAERKISIYRYNLPDPSSTQMTQNIGSAAMPDSYEGMMPALVVSPVSYEDKAFEDGTSLLCVSLLAGVFSRDPMNVDGPCAILNILEHIRRILLTHRVLEDLYEVQEPLSWQLFDEGTKPLWFGEMITQWRIGAPKRVWMDNDWRGDEFTLKRK